MTRQGESALSLASPGDILVIDAGKNNGVATWGEGHSLRAQINGLNGVVLHGATRDARILETGPLPIICRGTTPARSKGRFRTISVGEPVTLAMADLRDDTEAQGSAASLGFRARDRPRSTHLNYSPNRIAP